jgi:hypothetical protein
MNALSKVKQGMHVKADQGAEQVLVRYRAVSHLNPPIGFMPSWQIGFKAIKMANTDTSI